jgi:hypothetical protein
MKKLFLFAIVGLLLLASCKKTSSGGNVTTANTISAKIGGTQVAYSYNIYYRAELDGTNPLDYYFYAEAYDSTNTSNYLYISGDSYYGPITARTFGAVGDSTTDIYLEVDSSSTYYASVSSHPVTAKITTFGSTIQGTFNGLDTLYQYQDPSQPFIVVSNVKFNISQ